MEYHLDMRVITGTEARKLITCAEVVEAVEETFRQNAAGNVFHPIKEPMFLNEQRSNFIMAMAANLKYLRTAGVKWTNMMKEQLPGYPSCGGNLLILSDTENGQPYCMIEASEITAMRTGGGHAVVAAKYLAKSGSATLAIVGCGEEGRLAAESFLQAFPDIVKLRLCDKNEAAMEKFQAAHSDRAEISCFTDAKEAARECDILILATTCRKPLIHFEDLPAGCTVIGLYSFFDLDPQCAFKADKWVLGSRKDDTMQIIKNPSLVQYQLGEAPVYADMGEILTQKAPARENDREIIVYTHFGMGALDVAVGKLIYDKAVKVNAGQIIRMD